MSVQSVRYPIQPQFNLICRIENWEYKYTYHTHRKQFASYLKDKDGPFIDFHLVFEVRSYVMCVEHSR